MKKRLGVLLRIVVSVGILAYLFNSIFQKEATRYFEINRIDPATLSWSERTYTIWTEGPRGLWEVFQTANPWWFIAAVGCTGLVCLFGIIRWQLLLRVQELELRFSRATSIWFTGMFFNAFMLGATGGDVIKAWYAAHETHHKKAEAVVTVVVDRIIGMFALLLVALVAMGWFHEKVLADVALRSFAVVTLGGVVGAIATGLLSLWDSFPRQFPRVIALFTRLPGYELGCRLINAFRVYARHPAVLTKTILLSFGVHVAVIMSVVCVGYALRISTTNGMTDYFLYLPIINTIAAIPISIAGLGVREGMYAQLLGQVGVLTKQAVALSLLGYAAMLVWSLVGGVFFLTHRKDLPPRQEIVDGSAAV